MQEVYRRLARALCVALVSGFILAPSVARASSLFTDAAGRHVSIPTKITRVMAAGPPAALALYSLVPDKLIG
jgi:iron complex transport system substrate-binding protein